MDTTTHAKCVFHFVFSLGHFSFFVFPTAGRTKSSEFSQQHFQLGSLWSNNCELHAMLHCWQLYCFMFDILGARGEWYFHPVTWRMGENNAGTFESARKMNSLQHCEKHTLLLTITLFQTTDFWVSSPSFRPRLLFSVLGVWGVRSPHSYK